MIQRSEAAVSTADASLSVNRMDMDGLQGGPVVSAR